MPTIGGRELNVFDDIAFNACARFADRVAPQFEPFRSEEVGHQFHMSVAVRALDLAEKWAEAVDDLAAAVLELGPRTYFEPLLQPQGVTFTSGTSMPRLVVLYVPPTVDDTGRLVPGYDAARFDVRGVTYGAAAQQSEDTGA
jgi:hypothetical protein